VPATVTVYAAADTPVVVVAMVAQRDLGCVVRVPATAAAAAVVTVKVLVFVLEFW
jgi:hypothetical protein